MAVVKIKMRYDSKWEEYQVQVWIDGKLDEDKTYHTNDKDDAIRTKHAMKQEAVDHPERYQTTQKNETELDYQKEIEAE